LDGYHQDALHIAGVNRGGCPNSPNVIVAEGGEEVLGHRSIMTELFGILADMVPALHGDLSDLLQHLFSVHGLEILLLVAVGDRSKAHLPFDDSDRAIPDADFVGCIHYSAEADGCGVP